jgi:hypothetical protein
MDQLSLSLNIELVHLSFYSNEHPNDQDEQPLLLHQAIIKILIKNRSFDK